jgi:hypothetical protein
LKRFLAILCFSAIITAGTELHQLFKLPVFLQHFYEHKKEDKEISLFRFIIMHYFKGSPRDKDYDRDMQLPFKTTDCTSALVSIVVPPHTITTERPEFFIKRSYPAVKNNSIQSSHLSDIWQPPKFS